MAVHVRRIRNKSKEVAAECLPIGANFVIQQNWNEPNAQLRVYAMLQPDKGNCSVHNITEQLVTTISADCQVLLVNLRIDVILEE